MGRRSDDDLRISVDHAMTHGTFKGVKLVGLAESIESRIEPIGCGRLLSR